MEEKNIVLWKNTNDKTDYSIKLEDRFRHQYILWNIWVGKSKFMEKQILQDIENWNWCCVIDIHGDSVENIIKNTSKEVIIIDTSDFEQPNYRFNILNEIKNELDLNSFINLFSSSLEKFHDNNSNHDLGVHFNDYIYNSLRTLFIIKDIYTLSFENIWRFLNDRHFLWLCLEKLKTKTWYENEILFWNKFLLKIEQKWDYYNEIIPYIWSKLKIFSSNKYINNILNSEDSNINIFDIMNKWKVILFKWNKGIIMEENAKILWLLLIQSIILETFKRTSFSSDDRKPFFLYIDDLQYFSSSWLTSFIHEWRKYKVWIIMANQSLDQLTISGWDIIINKRSQFIDSILWNVWTLIFFKNYKWFINDQFLKYRKIDEDIIENLDKYNCFVSNISNWLEWWKTIKI